MCYLSPHIYTHDDTRTYVQLYNFYHLDKPRFTILQVQARYIDYVPTITMMSYFLSYESDLNQQQSDKSKASVISG